MRKVITNNRDIPKPLILPRAYRRGNSIRTLHVEKCVRFIGKETFTWYFLMSCSSGVDILISTTDCKKLTQESKELLCAGCEMAQLRCAKLINVRGKVRAAPLCEVSSYLGMGLRCARCEFRFEMCKSSFKPRGSSSRSFSFFPKHEASRSIATFPWIIHRRLTSASLSLLFYYCCFSQTNRPQKYRQTILIGLMPQHWTIENW